MATGDPHPSNPLEIPPWERPGSGPEEGQDKGPIEPLDMEPSTEIGEEQEKKLTEARTLEWKEAAEVLMGASDPEELGRVAQVTGSEIGPDEAARLLSLPPHERLGILLRVPALDEQDEAYLKQHREIGRAAYQRQKAVAARLSEESFDVGPKGSRLSKKEQREARARMAFIVDMRAQLEQGGFGALSPEDQERVNGLLTQSLQVDEYIVALSGNENAQQTVYNALNEGGLSAQELVGRMVLAETEYALGPKDQEDHARWAELDVSLSLGSSEPTPAAAVIETLEIDPGQVEVVGHNAQGDVILKFPDETECTVGRAPGGNFVVNAIKVNILGTEFVQQQPAQVSNGREFGNAMGQARAHAALVRHGLPFRGPEAEHIIELFARESGEIREFTYDQYPKIEQDFLAFLRALTPEGEQDQTLEFCQEIGIIRGSEWDQSRWQTVAASWVDLRKVEDPREAHVTLRDRFGNSEEEASRLV